MFNNCMIKHQIPVGNFNLLDCFPQQNIIFRNPIRKMIKLHVQLEYRNIAIKMIVKLLMHYSDLLTKHTVYGQ